MKKLLFIGIILFFGCSSIQISDPENCTVYEEYGATWENSLIASKIPDPCLATRLITTAAKLPAVKWKRKYTLLFDEWASKIEAIIQGNVTYADLQNIILLEVSKLNTQAGLTMLVISEGIFVFDDQGILKEKDVELLLALISHLRAEVKSMEAFL